MQKSLQHDKRVGTGTMSRAGARCPWGGRPAIMTMEDIRLEGRAGMLGSVMTAVVVAGGKGKEYRPPARGRYSGGEASGAGTRSDLCRRPFWAS